MRSFVRAVVAGLGIASLPAVLFAFFHLLPLVADVFVLRRAASYAPAVFEVEWVRFDDDASVAVGTIGGKRELLSLQDVLPRRATGLNDLQDLMASTRRLDVLYDRGGTATGFEGRRIRVLPAALDLRADRWRRITRTLLLGYGPAVLLIGLGLVVAWVNGEKLGCFFMPSLFFLGVQPLFALFIVAVEVFQ